MVEYILDMKIMSVIAILFDLFVHFSMEVRM